ncbi:MAG: hypothetical protein GY867_07415 [bacterium]|nr:hypothetical protein [bacterium]
MSKLLWLEPGKTEAVPVTFLRWRDDGRRAMILTAEGAEIDVMTSELREVEE